MQANDRSAIWSHHATRFSRPRLPGGPRLADFRQRHSLGGSGFVKLDAWRCMDRSRKIGKQMTGQPFGASAPLASLGLDCPSGSRQRLSLGGTGFMKADAWSCMDRSRKIGKQMTGQPFGASTSLVPLAFAARRAPAGGLPPAPLAWGRSRLAKAGGAAGACSMAINEQKWLTMIHIWEAIIHLQPAFRSPYHLPNGTSLGARRIASRLQVRNPHMLPCCLTGIGFSSCFDQTQKVLSRWRCRCLFDEFP